MKTWLSFLVLPLFLAVAAPLPAAGDAPSKDQPIIVLAGDSTVAPNGGWGDGFAKLLAPGVKCINLAKGGRSSKSYRDEKFWKQVLDAKPAWVLIQFGHNDQPGKGTERETDPATTYRQNMARYVDEAKAAGAKPVLVTSLTRRNFDEQGKIKPDALAGYVEAVKALAAEKQVPLIDLNARSVEQMNRLGPEKAAVFDRPAKAAAKTAVPAEPTNPANPDAPAAVDHTHLSAKGEAETAKLVAEEIRGKVPELAKYLTVPK
ncbi:MAG: rhamnogalacturonan acetylesterase [Verrucomicrobiota bacterium]